MLKMLMESKNQPLRREIAQKNLWGRNDYFNRRSMDVRIAHLRKYLKGVSTMSIVNMHGKSIVLAEK